MFKQFWMGVVTTLVITLALLLGRAGAQDGTATTNVWDAARMKQAIEDIGYETSVLNKEAGKEKYEFKLERGGLTIPIAAELSSSKNYLWLTIKLNDAPKDYTALGPKLSNVLKANAKIQPCHFYITAGGSFMVGVAVENRALTNAILRRNIEKLVTDVVEQKSVWSL